MYLKLQQKITFKISILKINYTKYKTIGKYGSCIDTPYLIKYIILRVHEFKSHGHLIKI